MFREMWLHIRPGGIYWIEDMLLPVNYATSPAMARMSQNATFMRNVRSMTFHKGASGCTRRRDVPAFAMRRGGNWQSDSFEIGERSSASLTFPFKNPLLNHKICVCTKTPGGNN